MQTDATLLGVACCVLLHTSLHVASCCWELLHESIKSGIFVSSHVQIFFVFLLKWTKSGKEVIYGKKNGGHRAFKRVKSLRSSQSDVYSHCHAIA